MTRHQLGERAFVAMLILLPAGCAAINRVNPVERPPVAYQQSRPILVEFVPPEAVMARCFERGSLVPASACSDTNRITISNPCATSESYARLMCHELGHVNGWDATHRNIPLASDSPQARMAILSKVKP